MTIFDSREDSFEKKFAHDETLRFKVTARRNKLLGLWAAEQLGYAGERADAYAKEVVASDFEAPGDDDVLQKVLKDLHEGGISITGAQVRTEMDSLMQTAKKQIMEQA